MEKINSCTVLVGKPEVVTFGGLLVDRLFLKFILRK
jgi:hypothetical protein